MNRTAKWASACLALLVVAAALSAFSTEPAVGTSNAFYHHASATGPILGAGLPLPVGSRVISIGSAATTVGGCLVQLWGEDLVNGTDTVAVYGSWSGRFAGGLDSANVLVNGAGITVQVGR